MDVYSITLFKIRVTSFTHFTKLCSFVTKFFLNVIWSVCQNYVLAFKSSSNSRSFSETKSVNLVLFIPELIENV